MFFFPHNFHEIFQNFGILVPVKMNNKQKRKKLEFYLFIYFFSIKSVINFVILVFWYLRNLKTLIIHVSRNVFSFPKHRVLFMYLSVFIGNMIKKTQNTCFGNVILYLHKKCFACVLAFWYVISSKTLKGKFLVKVVIIPM